MPIAGKLDGHAAREFDPFRETVACNRDHHGRAGFERALDQKSEALITTTAEGVETIDQLDWLRAEGCNEVQGFLFSAAKPAAEVEALLLKFGRRASQAA